MHRTTSKRCAVLVTFGAWLCLVSAAAVGQGQVIQGAPDSGVRLGKPGGAEPTHVCIDTRSSPAWTLMVATAEAGCAKKGMERVALSEFGSPAVRQRLRTRVLRDALPGHDALRQIGLYLKQMPGAPIGLTWDGGMAITATDYRAADLRHAQYIKDPQAYIKAATAAGDSR